MMPARPTEFYHGTSIEAALSIQESGFRADKAPKHGALLGVGVYCTTTIEKALPYAKNEEANGVILKLEIDLGKCKELKPNDPMMTTWQHNGYDSAWAPRGTDGTGMEENCIKDPARIKIVDAIAVHTGRLHAMGMAIQGGRLVMIGDKNAESWTERVDGLQQLVEKLWRRYAVFKSENVQGVFLQSEVRGLVAKMGTGADLDSVLEERDCLRVKQGDSERLAAELQAKIVLLESQVMESAKRLDEAMREAENQQAKLRAERRGREASAAKCRELEVECEVLYKEACDAKDTAVVLEERDRQVAELQAKIVLLESQVMESAKRLDEAMREAENQQAKLRAERRGREASAAKCRELEVECEVLYKEARDAKNAAAAEKRTVQALRGHLNAVRSIKVNALSPEELDALFRRHDRDEVMPLIRELCDIMDCRLQSTRAELWRERACAHQTEADRERDEGRAKQAEARLKKQVDRLERDLALSEKTARAQARQLERRNRMNQELELAVESATAHGAEEEARIQNKADSYLKSRGLDMAIETTASDLKRSSTQEHDKAKRTPSQVPDGPNKCELALHPSTSMPSSGTGLARLKERLRDASCSEHSKSLSSLSSLQPIGRLPPIFPP